MISGANPSTGAAISGFVPSATVTSKLMLVVLFAASNAVSVTVVVPARRSLPGGGD
jgi:hypothetical protein